MPPTDMADSLGLSELSQYLKDVETCMSKLMYGRHSSFEETLRRLMSVRGKRLRPVLVLAAAGGKRTQQLVAAGTAVELAHLASLIHDDIIDNATTRWNMPTISSQEGIGQAIVIGDYLLAKACEAAASMSAEVAELITMAIAQLCDGQSRELADQQNPARTKADYLAAIKGKTAALMAAACRLGGACAGLEQRVVSALGNFGENFGVAFQLLDDVLDFLASPDLAGKPVGEDALNGTYTLPLILALQTPDAKAYRKRLANETPLTDELMNDGFIQQALTEMNRYNQAASEALQPFTQTPGLHALQSFPDEYCQWALRTITAPQYKTALTVS